MNLMMMMTMTVSSSSSSSFKLISHFSFLISQHRLHTFAYAKNACAYICMHLHNLHMHKMLLHEWNNATVNFGWIFRMVFVFVRIFE